MTALVHGWVILVILVIIWDIWASWVIWAIWASWAILGSEKPWNGKGHSWAQASRVPASFSRFQRS